MSITPSWCDVVVFMKFAYVCVGSGVSGNGSVSPDGNTRGVAAAAAGTGAPVADGDGSEGGVAPMVGAGTGVAGGSVDAACGAATGSVVPCARASEAVPTGTARKTTDRRRN